MTCPHAYSDGVYVLGALGPAERSAYEAHLAECPSCANAVAQLAVLPGLLGRVSEEALQPVAPAPNGLDRLIEKVAALRRRQARRRRWRFATALAAVALLAVAGTAALLNLPTTPDPTGPVLVAMTPVADDTLVTAEVGYEPLTGGTKVWMVCRYPQVDWDIPPRAFRLVALATDGSSEHLGSWRASPGDEVDMAGLTQFTAGELAQLELQSAEGDTLLVYHVP